MARIPTFDVELVETTRLSSRVRLFRFRRADGAPLAFEAGQWLSLALPLPEGEIRRAYSIASAPTGAAEFELAITLVDDGPGSRWLHALEPGARLVAIGPQGFFTRTKEIGKPALHVATGTGVTPLRSMLLDARNRGETTPQWLLFGLRGEEDIIFRSELEALAGSCPWFRFLPTLSQGGAAWTGKRGYVQTHVREALEELERASGEKPHTFVCGLHGMVGAVRDLVRKEMNMPRELVHSERYD